MFEAIGLAKQRGNALRVRRLARQLTELSRLDAGLERPDLCLIDPASLLRSVCSRYPRLALEVQDAGPVVGDPRHLAAALYPILDNAILHGAPPVTTRLDAIGIAITDCGPGFPADLLPRATERFVTGSRASGRGVGLGLALAVAHAQVIGATLELANVPSAGAEVMVRYGQTQSAP